MGGQGDGGRRIAPHGLEHDRLRLDAHLAQLLRDQEAVRLVADHHRPRPQQALEPQRGLLDHGALARERQELLRIELAREGPKARAGAAGKNDWGEHRELSVQVRRSTARRAADRIVGQTEAADHRRIVEVAAVEDERRLE